MRKKTKVVIALLCLLVLAGVGFSVLYYRIQIQWTLRQFVTPRDLSLDMGVAYLGFNDTSGSKDFGDVADYCTFEDAENFTVTIQDIETDYYSKFDANVTFVGVGSVCVGIVDARETIEVGASKTNDITVVIDWTAKELGACNRTGTTTLIISVD